jgi:hypothetical protein
LIAALKLIAPRLFLSIILLDRFPFINFRLMARTFKQTLLRASLCAALAVSLCACAAATNPASTERPRADAAPYPVVIERSDERLARSLANWKTVVGEQAAATAPTPEFQSATATLKSLPASSTPPSLPTVIIKDEKQQTEEEMRESLRRFIATAAPLLGVSPQELSLVEVTDASSTSSAAGGAKTAHYQQNPFQYPLRNGYGVVEISFTPDLRVVGLSSTAIPSDEALRRALVNVKPTLAADKAVAALANKAVTFKDRSGNQQTRTITQADTLAARELVVFPVPRADGAALDLHVAWEVAVGGTDAPVLVYLDAVTGEQLAALQ